MNIKELAPKLGDKVKFSKTNTNAIAGYQATVLVIDHKDDHQTYLVGWKKEEDYPTWCAKTVVFGSHCAVIASYDDYHASVWVVNTSLIELPKSAGMKCSGKYCGVFSDFAEPNQSDGTTFLCFSCRQRPACMR